MIDTRQDSYRRYELLLLILLLLALVLPFIGQAIHIDARLFIDWAKQGLVHPLWQHLPNYDYFGVHYDEFHDTHPRLQSLYLSLFLKLNGGEVNEQMLHLAMLPFPIIALLSMYWLSRRFGAHEMLATLLLLFSPAFLVNSHLIMTDIPGIAFWLAAITFFIYGVDRNKFLLLALSSLAFTMCIFTYYQGLSVLPLALLYIIIYRRISATTISALLVPCLLFLAFVSAHIAWYGEPPTFSYPFGLPLDIVSILVRLRGTLVLVGGAIIFPVAALVLYLRQRIAMIAVLIAASITFFWMAVLFVAGDYPLDTVILLPLLLGSGIAVLWIIVSLFIESLKPALRNKGKQDQLLLSTWFLGTFFYCTMLLPYPSPRYLIPLVPPFAIIAAKKISSLYGADGRRFAVAAVLILIPTLVLSLTVAVSEHTRANNNRVVAEWAKERFGPAGAEKTIWFSGGLGFQYYIQPLGYRMLIIDSDEPAPGDLIVESVGNNRWNFNDRLKDRIALVDTVDFPRKLPVTTEAISYKISWLGQIGMVVPYGVSADYLDRIFIYQVMAEAPDQDRED